MCDQPIVDELRRLRQDAGSGNEPSRSNAVSPVEEHRRVANLSELLQSHPVFGERKGLMFGTKILSLQPTNSALSLFRNLTRWSSAEAAVSWLRKVYETNLTDIRVTAEVYGLDISEPIELNNGVELTPFGRLPSSRYVDSLDAHASFVSSFNQTSSVWPPIAATKVFRDVSAHPLDKGPHSGEPIVSAEEEIIRSVRGFTLADQGSPVVNILWAEFADPELALAEIARSWSGSYFEGSLRRVRKIAITKDDVARVNRYIELTGPTRDKVDLAISRLNLARRRISPGDKAIDGGICLEALLEDGQKTDITYKLRLRSALLTGQTFEQRREISKAIGDFYDLRSTTVHGNLSKKSASKKSTLKDNACAERGLVICMDVLRRIVDDGKTPDFNLLELSPSPLRAAHVC